MCGDSITLPNKILKLLGREVKECVNINEGVNFLYQILIKLIIQINSPFLCVFININLINNYYYHDVYLLHRSPCTNLNTTLPMHLFAIFYY